MCDILKNSCISQDNIFLPLINLLAQGKVSSTDLNQDKVTYLNRRALSVSTGAEFLKSQATYFLAVR